VKPSDLTQSSKATRNSPFYILKGGCYEAAKEQFEIHYSGIHGVSDGIWCRPVKRVRRRMGFPMRASLKLIGRTLGPGK